MAAMRILDNDHLAYGIVGNLRPHQVTFDPADSACLHRTSRGHLTFRFLAPVDTAEALVVIRDGTRVMGHEMRSVGAAGEVSFWEITLAPPAERLQCSLALRLEDGTPIYVGVTGVTAAIERIDRFEIEVGAVVHHQVPEWARGAVIYQIFPDRFASADPGLTPVDALPWGSPPTYRGFMGGDLDGIAAHLDHLVDLGIDVIYLNPIFSSPSNHRYDTRDYYTVDPMLGGNEALGRLVTAAHQRDMRIILDVSLNHLHPTFPFFQDVLRNGADSDYAGWFDVYEHPLMVRYRPDLVADHPYWSVRLPQFEEDTGVRLETVDSGPIVQPSYDTWYSVPQMPRVDLQHPDARQYMIDVATHWVREYAIDGWRMDVVRYIDHDFWADLRAAIEAERPGIYLLAEVMGDARRWLQGDEFDATMNYTFREICLGFFGLKTITAEEFVADYLRMLAMYSPAVTEVNQNLIGSHDTSRFLRLAGEDERRLLLATVFQLTSPGAPGLYYGDELPLTGGHDPDCRRAFDWERTGSDHHQAVRAVSRLRRHHAALRRGNIEMLPTVDQCVSFMRRTENEQIFVAINNGATTVDLGVAPGQHPGAILWSVGQVRTHGEIIELGPHAAVIGLAQ